MVSQSIRDCSEATGLVSSMYSTPKFERAVALLFFMSAWVEFFYFFLSGAKN